MTDSFNTDIARFCRIYQENVSEALNATFSRTDAELLKKRLDEAFDLFCESVANRLCEELR